MTKVAALNLFRKKLFYIVIYLLAKFVFKKRFEFLFHKGLQFKKKCLRRYQGLIYDPLALHLYALPLSYRGEYKE